MAGVGRVFRGVEYPSRREACQARHREYVRALADGLNFTQAAHAVGVSKRTGKVWRNGRTRSSGRCERASIAPQAHWYRLYMKCQPHRVSKRFLSLKERMLIFGWRVEGFSIRDIARQLGRSPSTVSRELKRIGRASNRGWCQGESAAGAANLLGPPTRRAGGPSRHNSRGEAAPVFVPQVAQLLAVGLAHEDVEGGGRAVAGQLLDGRGRRGNVRAVGQDDGAFG